MGRRLAFAVILRRPDTIETAAFKAGDEVPEWAEALITNPEAWADDADASGEVDEGDGPDEGGQPGDDDQQSGASESTDGSDGADGDETGEESGDTESADEKPADDTAAQKAAVPPQSGKGSGIEAWRAYALANGLEAAEDATRQEIIDGLAAEGIATEAPASE